MFFLLFAFLVSPTLSFAHGGSEMQRLGASLQKIRNKLTGFAIRFFIQWRPQTAIFREVAIVGGLVEVGAKLNDLKQLVRRAVWWLHGPPIQRLAN
jgi:hypothetical protein